MLDVLGRRTLALCAALSTMGVGTAWAQIGSGWTQYQPSKKLQLRGCGEHNGSGTERFELTCDTSGSDNRAEQRIQNDYTSGTRQFEGEVRVVSLDGTNISLKQTFMPNNGPFLLIAVANNGRLYTVGDGAGSNLATIKRGQWTRINTVHDVDDGTIEIYINGSLRYTKPNARKVAWHDKYGAYRTSSGRGPVQVEWRNVRFFRDGSTGKTAKLLAADDPGFAFEAENLPVTSSDTAAPLDGSISLDATAPGSWVEFTLPIVPPGEYMLKLNHLANPRGGQVIARVDGAGEDAEIGGVIDQFASEPTFTTSLLGNVSFGDTTPHKVRLVATGQTPGSEGLAVSADSFTLQSPFNGGNAGEPLTDGLDVTDLESPHGGFGCTMGGSSPGFGWAFGIALVIAVLRRRRDAR
jgi:hypothetical protein